MKPDNQSGCGNYEFPMRLERFISICGVTARRKAFSLIEAGHVKVNHKFVSEPGIKISQKDIVECSGKILRLPQKHYIMLNKPVGYWSTSADPYADKLVTELVKIPGIRLYCVGRLDRDSEGMLLLTNDGDFAGKITHPRYGIYKKYKVTVDKFLSDELLRKICTGIYDDGEYLKAVHVERVNKLCYILTMNEGKKREIRRIMTRMGAKINRLKRIAIGGLYMGSLPSGTWRSLNERELKLCRKSDH